MSLTRRGVLRHVPLILALSSANVAIIASCAKESSKPPLGHAEQAASSGCQSDSDCAANMLCKDASTTHAGTCHCTPGWEVCGATCTNLLSDANNCGLCNNQCAAGESCSGRTCSGGPAPPSSVDTIYTLNDSLPGTDGGSDECYWAHEGSLHNSASTSDFFVNVNWYRNGDTVDTKTLTTNKTTGGVWSGWVQDGTPTMLAGSAVALDGGWCPRVDPSGTSSSIGTGLEYATAIMRRIKSGSTDCSTTNDACIGIAMASMAGIPAWTLTCLGNIMPLTAGDFWDGPDAKFDNTTTDGIMYVAATLDTSLGDKIALFSASPCTSASCTFAEPDTWLSGEPITGHIRVALNPCTGHLAMGWRDTSDNIRMAFTNQDASVTIGPETIAANAHLHANLECAGSTGTNGGDCGGNGPIEGNVCACGGPSNSGDCQDSSVHGSSKTCTFVATAPSMTIRSNSTNSCYLYLAWDESWEPTGSSSLRRMRSKYAVYEIGASNPDAASDSELNPTQITAPTVVATHAVDGSHYPQTFGADVMHAGSSNIGVFYYHDDGTHCSTSFRGTVSANTDFSSASEVTIESGFPTIIPYTPHVTEDTTDTAKGGTMGDYLAGAREGANGKLAPAYAVPVETNNTHCLPCNGKKYYMPLHGTKVTP